MDKTVISSYCAEQKFNLNDKESFREKYEEKEPINVKGGKGTPKRRATRRVSAGRISKRRCQQRGHLRVSWPKAPATSSILATGFASAFIADVFLLFSTARNRNGSWPSLLRKMVHAWIHLIRESRIFSTEEFSYSRTLCFFRRYRLGYLNCHRKTVKFFSSQKENFAHFQD